MPKIFRRTKILLVISVALLVVAVSAITGFKLLHEEVRKQGLELEMGTDKTTYQQGEDIHISITLMNYGPQKVDFVTPTSALNNDIFRVWIENSTKEIVWNNHSGGDTINWLHKTVDANSSISSDYTWDQFKYVGIPWVGRQWGPQVPAGEYTIYCQLTTQEENIGLGTITKTVVII